MKKVFPFAFIFLLLGSCGNPNRLYNENPERFHAVMDSLSDEHLIDVRVSAEFNKGHIADAQNLEWNTDQFSIALQFDKNEPVMVYGSSGAQSADAAYWFLNHGFHKVYQLDGGLQAWENSGLALTKSTENTTTTDVPVSTASYAALVKSQHVVLADFSAVWCGPCHRLAPKLEELSQEMAGKFLLVKVDVDRDRPVADSMSIAAMPTLILYKDGNVVWRAEGDMEKDYIAGKLRDAQ
ncbi:MAG: hypothetical protein HY064_04295 [Bacteroidetes bacterium]|nr:hypothetical protein [Bacteroidota bacterium]